MPLTIRGARVVTPGRDLGVATIRFEQGRIAAVLRPDADGVPAVHAADEIDASGLTALPGFVDIHSHGRSGYDFCDATDEAFEVMGRDRLQDGVTSFLATGLTRPEEDLAELCRCAERYKQKMAKKGGGVGATCLGVHLEGPFFAADCAGAQNPAYLCNPDIAMVDRLHAISPVLKVSFSPELPGSEEFTRALVKRGIVASLGHSSADWDCFQRMRAAGLTHITHFCNVVTPLHHLRPGVVGGGLLADDVYVEMICDGIHLMDPMIDIIARLKGPDRMMIITDSMRAAGCPDGDYSLGGLPVVVTGGCARVRNADGSIGPIAGSTTLYYKGLQRLVRVTGLPLSEAVKATAYNQCRSLGIRDRGEIAVGQAGDVVLVDDELKPVKTIVGGEVVWSC